MVVEMGVVMVVVVSHCDGGLMWCDSIGRYG